MWHPQEKRPVKVGFIQARNEIDVNWFRPLAFGYLKAYVEKYLKTDEEVQMHFLDDLKSIDGFDVIGISATSQDFGAAKRLATEIKKANSEIITILGGHHVTYLPETLPREVDVGVMGEGEQTFLELIRLLIERRKKWTSGDLDRIKGLVYHAGGVPRMTAQRELIDPLDQIPIPSRNGKSNTYLFSSRGCPFKCSFCSSSAFWQRARFFSAEYVVREIESLLEPNGSSEQHVAVWDDLFIANRTRLVEIVDLLERRGLNRRVGFTFAVRANLVDDRLCELLGRMNVKQVALGFESGSSRILAILNKGVTVEVNQRALDTLHRHGIPASGSFIVGCPTETEAEVRSTYEFILTNIRQGKLSPHCAVNILSPMPGTKIWRDAVEQGLIDLRNMDWDRLTVFASFRNSTVPLFEEWVRLRRQKNTIYLAEETLPQERLFELMSFYENLVKDYEKAGGDADQSVRALSGRAAALSAQVTALSGQVAALCGEVANLSRQLPQVAGGESPKTATLFRRIRLLLVPPHSRRARTLRRLTTIARP